MTHTQRLAEMRERVEQLKRTLSSTEIAASLALTTKPDYREVIRDDYDKRAKYDIRAYGLTRCDGGYVIVRFSCPGQRDSVSFHLFDTWNEHAFGSVAQQIANKRIEMLEASK